MRKSLIAGASVFALVAGLSGTAFAQSADLNSASATNTMNQDVVNKASATDDENSNDGIGGDPSESFNNNFDQHTFQDQVLNQNNINSGINSAQQGGNAAAIAVDGDGAGGGGGPDVETNIAKAKNDATQTVTNKAEVDSPDDEGLGDGIGGSAEDSFNNNFGADTFDNQVINQNNINSGVNSAQQGGNAAAIAVDLDGATGPTPVKNTAEADNVLDQTVTNKALVGDDSDGNDAILGENNDSNNNNFGSRTFENQVINQNNINSGLNSAQQGANTVAIAVSAQDGATPSFGVVELDSETAEVINSAIENVAEAFDLDASAIGNGGDPEASEINKATATSDGVQDVTNVAKNEAETNDDGGAGGDPDDSFANEFGFETFENQTINQNNINAGINSAQQGANTVAIATDVDDGDVDGEDMNIANAKSTQDQQFSNKAKAAGEDNDGVGGFDDNDNSDSLYNNFGEETFKDQVINQNNINAGINNGQQGMDTVALAIDNSASDMDTNMATAKSDGTQNGENIANDSSQGDRPDADDGDPVEHGLGIGGGAEESNLNNQFGDNTFENQVINQNNINAGINSAQQGANTAAIAVADDGSIVDTNIATSKTFLDQGDDEAPLSNLAKVTGDESGGVGGNPTGQGDGEDPFTNEFGEATFQDQVINQNNINSGINSAQQGANTVAMAIDLGGGGGLDLNTAVALSDLDQTVTNTATVSGNSNAGIGGSPEYAFNNNFGDNTFRNQVMNQNNINSGINSVQQGANTVAVAFSGNSSGN
ncbi:hypothetical protein HBA54_02465 [Pelagibius litoralis]|uniref:Curlin associated repeat-containing protein n=1 Tax=Pelagibius litoralis TaxID=374515 RepID=A0A967EUN4_9PROT|nr:hypothetical protein [Pelagibius litoralis]NIA67446.1 hypothetical protein [Pelagibius litoralis]